jgi:hypothetical protein
VRPSAALWESIPNTTLYDSLGVVQAGWFGEGGGGI